MERDLRTSPRLLHKSTKRVVGPVGVIGSAQEGHKKASTSSPSMRRGRSRGRCVSLVRRNGVHGVKVERDL